MLWYLERAFLSDWYEFIFIPSLGGVNVCVGCPCHVLFVVTVTLNHDLLDGDRGEVHSSFSDSLHGWRGGDGRRCEGHVAARCGDSPRDAATSRRSHHLLGQCLLWSCESRSVTYYAHKCTQPHIILEEGITMLQRSSYIEFLHVKPQVICLIPSGQLVQVAWTEQDMICRIW